MTALMMTGGAPMVPELADALHEISFVRQRTSSSTISEFGAPSERGIHVDPWTSR